MNRPDLSAFKDPEWLKGLTLLIAEDDPTNYRLLNALLKRTGAEIHWAKDGEEAVNFIRNKPREEKCIVLMDIKMPVINGYEARKMICEIDDTIPVIAVTAYAQVSDKERILGSNFNGYVSKPIDPEILYGVLKQYSS
jgi:CheY-like chemotaxis protein